MDDNVLDWIKQNGLPWGARHLFVYDDPVGYGYDQCFDLNDHEFDSVRKVLNSKKVNLIPPLCELDGILNSDEQWMAFSFGLLLAGFNWSSGEAKKTLK